MRVARPHQPVVRIARARIDAGCWNVRSSRGTRSLRSDSERYAEVTISRMSPSMVSPRQKLLCVRCTVVSESAATSTT